MANNNGLVEIASSETYSQVQKLIADLKQVATEVNNINKNLGNSKLPSDNSSSLNQITQQNQRLNSVRQRANQLSAEEIVNQRTLRQNADQYARSVSVLGGAYQRLSAQQAIASKNVQNLIARGKTAEQTQRQYNRELRNAQKEFEGLNRKVLQADRAVGRFNRNVGNYPSRAISGIKDLIGAFGIVGGVAAIAAISKNIFNTTRQLQSMNLALTQVVGNSKELSQTQAFLARISEAYGIEIMGLTKSYTGFLAASQNAIESGAITASQIQDIFESVSKASGAMGLSVEQQEGAFLALQQMISKGNIQAEEIRGQLAERLPGAFGILAKSMGVTEQQLNKLLKDGKVLAAEVLPAFAKQLEKAYGVETLQRVESLNAATTRISNSWTEFVGVLNDAKGPSFLLSILDLLNDTIKSASRILASPVERNKMDVKTQEARGYDKTKELSEQKINNIQKERQSILSKMSLLEKIGTDESNKQIRSLQIRDALLKSNLATEEKLLKSASERNLIAVSEKLLELQKRGAEIVLERDANKKNIRPQSLFTDDFESDKARFRNTELNKELRLLNEKIGFYNGEYRYLLSITKETKENTFQIEKKTKALKRAKEESVLGNLKPSEEDSLIASMEYQIKLAEQFRDVLSRNGDEYREYDKKVQRLKLSLESVVNLQGVLAESGEMVAEKLKLQGEETERAEAKLIELQAATSNFLESIGSTYFSEIGFGSLNYFTEITDNGLTAFETLMAGADTMGEKIALVANGVGNVLKDVFSFMNQQQQAYFDAQFERLGKEKDLALEFAGESATGRAEIERQYEERRKELDRKKAKAQKETALFNAIVNVAQAVTAFLAEANYAGAILAGVLGAAQIAIISNTQVPEYALGTDFHGGGMALVGDGGKHEVVYQPSSGFSITPKNDTLVDLERGSKVYPDINSFLKNSGAMLGGVPNIELESSGLSASEMDAILGRYFSNITTQHTTIDKNGLNSYINTKSNSMKMLNNRVIGKGFTV